MTNPAALRRFLAGCDVLLLDFDGPICGIFAGYPAPVIARELAGLIGDQLGYIPETLQQETDPLEVLRWTDTAGSPQLTAVIEDALCAAELKASATAEPTPYSGEVITTATQAGKRVAVVSNNSPAAIAAYLARHQLDHLVNPVIGRPYARPSRMKPHPEILQQAMETLNTQPNRCVMVGDSRTDVEAARASGVAVIGFATGPHKREVLSDADATVTTMDEIAQAMTTTS
jgi:HAD superfamily hydrolase (TIGR01662 family)